MSLLDARLRQAAQNLARARAYVRRQHQVITRLAASDADQAVARRYLAEALRQEQRWQRECDTIRAGLAQDAGEMAAREVNAG